MLRRMRNLILTSVVAALLAGQPVRAGDAVEMVTVHPAGTDEVVLNPGMGLAFCSWAAPPQWSEGKTCWVDEISDHVYIRVPWIGLNPAPGVYTVEESELGRLVAALREHGKRYSLRIMPNCLSSPDVEDMAPVWIYDTGVDYVMVETSGGGQKFPVPWGEPYLKAMDGIVAELARLYDGDPLLEYVDVPVGSFGEVWFFGDYSEWLSYGYSTDRVIEATKDLIDLYRKHFRRTMLAVPLGEGHFHGEPNREKIRNQLIEYCRTTGVMPRQDGVWTDKHWLADRFREVSPDVATMWEPVGSIEPTEVGTAAIYDRALEGAPSYFNWYGKRSDTIDDQTERGRLRDFARKLGYRFAVASVQHPAGAVTGRNRRGILPIDVTWRNDGVAYCHDDVLMRVALIGPDGAVLKELWTWPLNSVRTWAPGRQVAERIELQVPAEAAGRVRLAFGLVTRSGRTLNLALREKGPDRLYPVSSVDCRREDFEPHTVWRQAEPAGWASPPGIEIALLPDGGPDGGPCLEIDGRDDSNAWNFALIKGIPALPGGRYRFSGWIKVDAVFGGRPAYLKMDCDDGDGRQVLYTEAARPLAPPGPDGGYPWRKFAIDAIAPERTASLSVAVEKGQPAPGATTCRLADLRVELVGLP